MWFLEVLSIRVHMALFRPDDLILINVLPNAWWCWIWSQFSPELRPAFKVESYRKPYQPKVDPAQIHVKVILPVYRKMDQWRYRELNHLLVYLYN